METHGDLGAYTFPALLANSLRKFSRRPALSWVSGTPMTYAEVGFRIRDMQNLLYRLGVNKGDKVALFSASSPYWAVAYFAIVNSGAIAVPLLPDFTGKEVATCLEHSGARIIIGQEKLLEKTAQFAETALDVVIRIEDSVLLRGKESRTGDWSPVVPEESDTASIIYTSGTTGRSKGVELSHKNLVWTAVQSQFFQRINKFDVGLSILPMSHVYEFTIGFVLFFLNGACVYYLEKPPVVSTLLPALAKVRPTIMLSVPIIMEKIYKNKIVPTFTKKESIARLYEKPFFRKLFHRLAGRSLKKTFGGRIKFFGIGGAKVDPKVELFLKEARFPYAIGYGLTETSPLLAGSGPKITVPGTIGPVMPGVELKIVDADPTTGIGEVCARGQNVMKGYYREPGMTQSVLDADGWFKTGDLGYMDSTGRLSLKGRSKNMILNATGENIYPEDIEFVLNQHPLVVESLVVEGENSSLVAYVQVDEEKLTKEAQGMIGSMTSAVGGAVDSAVDAVSDVGHMLQYKKEEIRNEIKFFVNEHVNRMSRIDRVEVIEKFEKTASQKIKRYIYSIVKHIPGKKEE